MSLLKVFGVTMTIYLFQAEDGIRDLVRSRGLGDVYKRQVRGLAPNIKSAKTFLEHKDPVVYDILEEVTKNHPVLLNLSLIHI